MNILIKTILAFLQLFFCLTWNVFFLVQVSLFTVSWYVKCHKVLNLLPRHELVINDSANRSGAEMVSFPEMPFVHGGCSSAINLVDVRQSSYRNTKIILWWLKLSQYHYILDTTQAWKRSRCRKCTQSFSLFIYTSCLVVMGVLSFTISFEPRICHLPVKRDQTSMPKLHCLHKFKLRFYQTKSETLVKATKTMGTTCNGFQRTSKKI